MKDRIFEAINLTRTRQKLMYDRSIIKSSYIFKPTNLSLKLLNWKTKSESEPNVNPTQTQSKQSGATCWIKSVWQASSNLNRNEGMQ
jgi:hypothetical protein